MARLFAIAGVVLFAIALAIVLQQLPSIAAGGLLHPFRRALVQARPENCENREVASDRITLRGWHCRPTGERRGTVVYLHGIADNRASGIGAISRFTAMGLDVIAFDSRAHGESDGDVCTYGFFEKVDLRRIIDTLDRGPLVLFGTSLGGAVAVQEAADDDRVSGVIAAEVFSDLRTVALERAPFVLTRGVIDAAFRLAEERGKFVVDAVSPVVAAKSITVPVLLIHGAVDRDTPIAHSESVLAALAGPKQLIRVDGVGHNESLNTTAVWNAIDAWIADVVGPRRQ